MPTAPFSYAQLTEHFRQLDEFLLQHQALWCPRPFTHLHLAWEAEHPELACWLRGRSLDDAEAAHNQPAQLLAPAPFPQLAAQATALSRMDELPTSPNPSAPRPGSRPTYPGEKGGKFRHSERR